MRLLPRLRGRGLVLGTAVIALLVPSADKPAVASRLTLPISRGGTLTIVETSRGHFSPNFNPDHGASGNDALAAIYEPLFLLNSEKHGRMVPWLARSYRWSSGNRVLTFYLRPDVLWSDRQPFTSNDVVYSFMAAKASKLFTFCHQCWSDVAHVSAPDPLTVVVRLRTPDTTMFFNIASSFPVPEHIFAKQSDPALFTNYPHPIGTGPFELGSFLPDGITLVRNPHYWQKGKPYIDKVIYPAYGSADNAITAIEHGDVDWAGVEIRNVSTTYDRAQSYYHHWYTDEGAPLALWLNDAKPPFDNVHVRRAISLALDRRQISDEAYQGYQPPANGALLEPQYTELWGDGPAMRSVSPRSNLTAAKAELKRAGRVDVTGSVALDVPNSSAQDIDAAYVVAGQLEKLGMNVQVNPLPYTDFFHALTLGTFDMGEVWTPAGGNSPYYLYRYMFAGDQTAPINDKAKQNYERYRSPRFDALVKEYAAAASLGQRITLMKDMERLAAADRPVVPLLDGAEWDDYSTQHFTGWPSPRHAYDVGSPAAYCSSQGWCGNLDVLLQLHER
ncbi:MAG TPA: ABC transporter substrate-binding protein [Chloroflexota bacterium]|nr:ABC transporter substrate-binding protein [Chloroflexota bacterium]